MSSWRDVLGAHRNRLRWERGAAPEEIADAEAALGVRLPVDLRALLSEADGFYDTESQYAYAWDLRRMVVENTRHWQDDDLPLDHDLLAFGADGSGTGIFCLSLEANTSAVYYWNFIESERREIAPDLGQFWTGWLNGTLTV